MRFKRKQVGNFREYGHCLAVFAYQTSPFTGERKGKQLLIIGNWPKNEKLRLKGCNSENDAKLGRFKRKGL